MSDYTDDWVDWARKAFGVKKPRRKKSIDLLASMRPMLEEWGRELERDAAKIDA